jgi:ribosomal protein S18 acetylase RimI-like enzyme
VSGEATIRRELHPGDLDAIVAHHARVYGKEYRVDADFARHVAERVAHATARGFPSGREGIWLVELDGEHAGSLALTDEGNGEAAVRWFVLSPKVRGRGLGRLLIDELLTRAAQIGYERVWLETFSELETAAHLYRNAGFKLISTDTAPRWGRERIEYQRYELELSHVVAA